MTYKRIIAVTTLIFCAASLFACDKGNKDETKKYGKQSYELNVLTSFLPIYVFTMNVVKGAEDVNIDVLIPPKSAGPHDYDPTPSDMKKVEKANIFLANGNGLEPFLDRVRQVNKQMVVVEVTEKMRGIPDIPHDRLIESNKSTTEKEMDTEGDTASGTALNPHFWVSPYRAAEMVEYIAQALIDIDLKNAELYRKNADEYIETLENLGEEFRESLVFADKRRVVTIHNAFDYLALDSGFFVVAVLRLDPRSEPRPAELTRIANTIRNERVAAIFTEPLFPIELADTLAEETGTPVYELDPMATGAPSLDLYQKTMLVNLHVLMVALGSDQ